MSKIYVGVNCTFDELGTMTPEFIIWDDGRRFEIDRVLEVRRASSEKAGGCGLRFTCRILGKERHLFYEDMLGKWFVEGKESKVTGKTD